MTAAFPRVAVIGSCVTAEALKMLGISHQHLAFSVSLQSLASLTAELPSYPDPAVLGPLALPAPVHQWLEVDLTKTVPSMLDRSECDILILDLIDERFDLIVLASGMGINASQDFLDSGLADTPFLAGARRIPRLSQESWDLWEAGLVRLRKWFIRSPIKECRVLLHRVSWASTWQAAPGTLEPLPDDTVILPTPERQVSRSAHQALLDRYHRRFLAEFPEAIVIEAPPARIDDPGHCWGFAPYHFIPRYYSAIAEQVRQHGVRHGRQT